MQLICAAMVGLNESQHKSELIENLIDESGVEHEGQSHAELFELFLQKSLLIQHCDLLKAMPATKNYVDQMIQYCIHHEPVEVLAFLAYGVEGMVPRLYQDFIKGLHSIDLTESQLQFFYLHVECDDGHGDVLKTICHDLLIDEESFVLAKRGLKRAFELRQIFFQELHDMIQINKQQLKVKQLMQVSDCHGQTKISPLYQNTQDQDNIDFTVHRFELGTCLLDPRMLVISPKAQTEAHQHAHETVFFIIEGEGYVLIGDDHHSFKTGDLVAVPRWQTHQTINLSDTPLRILAITDYYFAQSITHCKDSDYRQQPH